jgi:hypothetical protein
MFIILVNCTPDRTFTIDNKPVPPVGGANNIIPGTLRVNEYVAAGSLQSNELVTSSDWFEIFNTTNDTIRLVQGKWFVTDSLGEKNKWELPDTLILPRGFLVIWCDNEDTTITQMHSSFRLSSSGEDIGIAYFANGTDGKFIDSLTFTGQDAGFSEERYPDGSTNWVRTANNTPGAPNQP